jgi:hypothetical protein
MLYLPAYYKDGQIIPAAAPCFVNQYGLFNAFQPDKKSKQTVRVSRKYPKRGAWDNYNKRIWTALYIKPPLMKRVRLGLLPKTDFYVRGAEHSSADTIY